LELAIDTSTEYATLALSSKGEVITDITWHAGQNHTAECIPHLISLMDQAGISISDVDCVIVARGPGSFNGLRVGITTAKGIAFAQKVPVVGISSLEVEAHRFADTGLPVCAIVNAGRGEIAAAVFQKMKGTWSRLVDEHITIIDELVHRILGRTIFCGRIPDDDNIRIKELLKEEAVVIDEWSPQNRTASLVELGWKRLREHDYDDVTTLQPLYLRKPSITQSKKK